MYFCIHTIHDYISLGYAAIAIYSSRRNEETMNLKQFEQTDLLSTKFEVQQATDTDIEWIAELEKKTYSGIDAIPYTVLKEWYTANSNAFFVIRNKNGIRVGHVDILPLRQETLNEFISGKIIEHDIRGNSLFKPDEREKINHLYIESLAIPYVKGFARSYALKEVLLSLDKLIETICDPDFSTIIYAMPASEEGKQIIEKLNFSITVEGKNRKGGYSIYKIPFFELKTAIQKITT